MSEEGAQKAGEMPKKEVPEKVHGELCSPGIRAQEVRVIVIHATGRGLVHLGVRTVPFLSLVSVSSLTPKPRLLH